VRAARREEDPHGSRTVGHFDVQGRNDAPLRNVQAPQQTMTSQYLNRATLSRRAFLGSVAGVGAAVALPAWPAIAETPAGRQHGDRFRVALSVSPFTETVLGSLELTDGSTPTRTVTDVQRLFNRHGASEVFVRVATRKHARLVDAEYGISRTLERARLARDLGMPLNPELGLWAVYGDIRDQPPPDFRDYPSIQLPGPWSSLTLPQMEGALGQYGALAARQILATGVQVGHWDLGNEVESGIAGVAVPSFGTTNYSPPDAVDPAIGQMTALRLLSMPVTDQIAWLQRHLWPYVGRLLAAVAHGVRSVDRTARFSTHLANIAVQDATLPIAFWQAMHEAGYRPDEFGTSLYPTNGDPGDRMGVFLDIATALRRRFGRQSFFAEFAYPSGQMQPPFAWNNTQPRYPQTHDGQYRYLRDLVIRAVQSRAVVGIRPWGPDYCTASGGWSPMSLFTENASAKPALDAIQDGLRAAVPHPRD
jgi:Glycosyl hydrolase family 53